MGKEATRPLAHICNTVWYTFISSVYEFYEKNENTLVSIRNEPIKLIYNTLNIYKEF